MLVFGRDLQESNDMPNRGIQILVVLLFIAMALAIAWQVVPRKTASASVELLPCKAAAGEQCPSDNFLTEYKGWRNLHDRIMTLKQTDGKISDMTHLDREWKGWRDDLAALAQQECPGCSFDDKTLKFTLPKPAQESGKK